MRTNHRKYGLLFEIIIRTIMRFNPAVKPVIPVNLTVYLCAVIFSFIFFIQWIQHNFIEDYGKLALSGWCFVMLMNLFEVIGEISDEGKKK